MKLNKYISLIILILLFSSVCLLFSDDVIVEAYIDRNEVGVGEVFRYTIEVRGESISTITPDMANFPFDVLNSSKSSSSSMSIVNGKVSSQKTERITYSLQSTETGRKQIPAISVRVGRANYVTNPIMINVLDTPTGFQNQSRQPQSNTSSQGITGNDFFLQASVDKSDVYRNEKIILTYKLYSTTSQVSNISLGSEPSFAGFWKEEIPQTGRPQMQREVFEGKQYYTLLLRRIALFPSREGRLMIPETDIRVDVVIPARSFFDFGTTRSVNLKSKPFVINVRALPEFKSDGYFINAVGSFDIESSLSATEGQEGNSLTYRVTVRGTGNYNQVTMPSFPEIRGLRFLSPEIQDTRDNVQTRFSGSRTFVYPVLLTEAGIAEIPEIKLYFFDLNQKRYRSQTLTSAKINISPGVQQVITAQGAQQSIRVLGRDIEFININPSLSGFRFVFRSFWYIFILILCPLSLILHYLLILETNKLNSDLHYKRNRRANRIIRKYLKDADQCVIERSMSFYDYAYQGLMHFLTDKLNISRGVVEKSVLEHLEQFGFDEKLIESLKDYLNLLNKVKYSNQDLNPEKIKDDALILKDLVAKLLIEFNQKAKWREK